jgi:hypothetical protein
LQGESIAVFFQILGITLDQADTVVLSLPAQKLEQIGTCDAFGKPRIITGLRNEPRPAVSTIDDSDPTAKAGEIDGSCQPRRAAADNNAIHKLAHTPSCLASTSDKQHGTSKLHKVQGFLQRRPER